MNREEVEKILSEGNTNPQYQVALNIAKQNGWLKDINSTEAQLPDDFVPGEDKKSLLQKFKDNAVASADDESYKNMMMQRADVINGIERSKGANPSVGLADRMTDNVTGLKGNSIKGEDINPDGSLTPKAEAKAVQNRLNNVGNDTGDTGAFNVGNEVAEVVEEANTVTQPSENDTPTETKAKNKYKNQSMSIWDAYYNGEFGEPGSDEAKSTRNYFIIDAIANFAKNTGRSIGNVGAQYSGGTIDNGHDTSKWEEIRNTLGGEELSIAKEGLGGHASRLAKSEELNNTLTQLSANRAATVNDLINNLQSQVDKMDDSNPLKTAYLSLIASMANGNINGETTLAAAGITTGQKLLEFLGFGGKGE